MLKKIGYVIGGLFVVGVLMNMFGETEPVVEKAEEKVVEKVEAEKKVVEEKPKKEPLPEKADLVSAYATDATPILLNLTNNLEDITTLANIGASDPMTMMSNDYLETVQLVCDDMLNNIADHRALDTRGVPEIEESHELMSKAIDELEFVAINLPIAVENLDSDLIVQCTEALGDSMFYMNKSTEKLAEIGGDLF